MILENRALAALLFVLGLGSWLSWHHEPEEPGTTIVQLVDVDPKRLTRVELAGSTATVAVSFRTLAGERRPWIEVDRKGGRRAFVGNEAFEKALGTYARLEALRSLGRLTGSALEETGLERPERILTIETEKKTYRFELGGQTSGARDIYARREGDDEVVLFRSTLVRDLESPQGRFMQRQLRGAPGTEVAGVELSAEGRTLSALHKNRLSPSDAYWARADAPDTVDEALGTFVSQLERLSATRYIEDETAFEEATPLLTAVWTGPDGQRLDAIELRRRGEGKDATYLARSDAVGRPVEVARFTATRLEEDLDGVLTPR